MQSVGINIGSTSLKMALFEYDDSAKGGKTLWSASIPHEGDFTAATLKLLAQGNIPQGIPALVTGNEGRFLFNVSGTLEPLCVEAALRSLDLKADAVVSMGGEDLIVYSLDANGKIINNFSGNKCASGTGEFLKQQLARMDMTLENIEKVSDTAKVYPLSTRCSVFMKSDCTHKLNKREAGKDDVVLRRLALVELVGAVAFHKDRAARGKGVDFRGVRHPFDIIKGHVHAG